MTPDPKHLRAAVAALRETAHGYLWSADRLEELIADLENGHRLPTDVGKSVAVPKEEILGTPAPTPVVRPQGTPAKLPAPASDGDRLRELRGALGYSQARCAQVAGFKGPGGQAEISKMERGERPVTPGLLDLLRRNLRDKKLGDRGRIA